MNATPSPSAAPVERRKLHTRTVLIEGFARSDGLWDIEARMTDVKTYGFDNHDRGRIEAGEPLHDMRLCLTVDAELRVHAIAAATAASPYRICPHVTPNYDRLKSAVIGPGWQRRIREAVGGPEGCTHLNELLAAMATVAVQTLWAERERRRRAGEGEAGGRPPAIDSCHALKSDGEIVRRYWPEFSTRSPSPDDAGS